MFSQTVQQLITKHVSIILLHKVCCAWIRKQQGKVIQYNCILITKMWPDLQKPDIMMHYGNPYFCISMFYIPKALFSSNIINVVLQVTRLDSKRSNTLALYVFLRWLILQTFSYTIITYGHAFIKSLQECYEMH